MKWFRSQIKHGSRLALFALAIQFVLSFGHFHAIATAQAAPAVQSSIAAADSADRQLPSSNHDSDQHPNDGCAICAVIALANAMLSATPPLLLLPKAVEFSYRITDAEFAHLDSARVVFQPRAPPIA
jgi:hypothetical protein